MCDNRLSNLLPFGLVAGLSNFFCSGEFSLVSFFFRYAFSAASVAIVAGTVAERCQITAYVWYSIVLAGFVYPIVAHALWSPQGFFEPTES